MSVCSRIEIVSLGLSLLVVPEWTHRQQHVGVVIRYERSDAVVTVAAAAVGLLLFTVVTKNNWNYRM